MRISRRNFVAGSSVAVTTRARVSDRAAEPCVLNLFFASSFAQESCVSALKESEEARSFDDAVLDASGMWGMAPLSFEKLGAAPQGGSRWT
jgi:hypothetical protein